MYMLQFSFMKGIFQKLSILWWSLNPHFPLRGFINLLRPRQNSCHFADIFRLIFLHENCCILIQISLRLVPEASIHSKSALNQKMACCPTSDEPLFDGLIY